MVNASLDKCLIQVIQVTCLGIGCSKTCKFKEENIIINKYYCPRGK